MPEEKKENIKTNKVRLFIERAKNIKVFFWAFVVIFILILSFNNQENISGLIIIAILGAFLLTSFLWVVFWLITQPYIVFSNNNKNIFEKILLMLVWAINLLILLMVTTIYPFMQRDFSMMAKVNASLENHIRATSILSEYLVRCSTGELEVFKLKGKSYVCSNTANEYVNTFVLHFESAGWKNPHDAQQFCCANKYNKPPLKGAPNTHIYANSDNQITIKTNIGTEDGEDNWVINKVTEDGEGRVTRTKRLYRKQ
jgi:hypothetical protein